MRSQIGRIVLGLLGVEQFGRIHAFLPFATVDLFDGLGYDKVGYERRGRPLPIVHIAGTGPILVGELEELGLLLVHFLKLADICLLFRV